MTTHENCDGLRTENKRLKEEIVEGIAREHYFKHEDREANRYRQYLDMVCEALEGYFPMEKVKP